MNLLIRNGRVVDPANALDRVADVLIERGVVSRVGPALMAPADIPTVDAGGRVVAPGFIDIHVHLREPGHEYKETVVTGTRAAAAGGFTAVACMANTQPVNDTRAVTDLILAQARTGAVRVYPIGAVTRGLKGAELAELGELAEAGCVAYSDDGQPIMNSALLRRALEYAQAFNRPIISHAEDAALIEGGAMNEGFVSTDLGLRGIPAAAEEIMVARDIALADLTGHPVHIAHVSTSAAVRLLRDAKARGVPVTGEVTPHHLLLTDEALRAYDPNAKMAPPLRSKRDVEACREALADGTLDAIATDHAPHGETEKQTDFESAPFGIIGFETALGLALERLYHTGKVSLLRLAELFSTTPARILSVEGGQLKVGAPADITIFDLEKKWTYRAADGASKSRNSPFDGRSFRGAPIATIVNGAFAFRR